MYHYFFPMQCPGCPEGGLDLTEGLFSYFGDTSVGVFQGTWHVVGDGSQSPPESSSEAPTTTYHPPPPTITHTHERIPEPTTSTSIYPPRPRPVKRWIPLARPRPLPVLLPLPVLPPLPVPPPLQVTRIHIRIRTSR